MDLRIVEDDGDTTREFQWSAPSADVLGALLPGEIFGTFDFAAKSLDESALRFARERPSRAYFAAMEDHELRALRPIAYCTYDRGVLAATPEERLWVLTRWGEAFDACPTLAGLYHLASHPVLAATLAPDDDARAAIVRALKEQPLVPPLALDRRKRRGVTGFMAALRASEAEADALLPTLLETTIPVLTALQILRTLREQMPERTDLLRQFEKLGNHQGALWASFNRGERPPVPPDPIAELVEAGWGCAGACEVPPFSSASSGSPAAHARPRAVLPKLRDCLTLWRGADAEWGARLTTEALEVHAQDVYFAMRWIEEGGTEAAEVHLSILEGRASPVVAALRADYHHSSGIDALLGRATDPRAAALLDEVLLREHGSYRDAFLKARSGEGPAATAIPAVDASRLDACIAARCRMRASAPIDADALAAEVARRFEAADPMYDNTLGPALEILLEVDGGAGARLVEKHTPALAEMFVMRGEKLNERLVAGKFVRALVKLARCARYPTQWRLQAAHAALALGANEAAALVRRLEARAASEDRRL